MSGRNEFTVEFLADGRVKVTNNGGFDSAIHADADEALAEIEKLFGTPTVVKKPKSMQAQPAHKHTHKHSH